MEETPTAETPTAAPGCCAVERTEDDVPPCNQAERFVTQLPVGHFVYCGYTVPVQRGGTEVESTSVAATSFAPLELCVTLHCAAPDISVDCAYG